MSNPYNQPPGKFGLASSEEEKQVHRERMFAAADETKRLKAELLPQLEAMFARGDDLVDVRIWLRESEAEYRKNNPGIKVDAMLHMRITALYSSLDTTYSKWVDRDLHQRKKRATELRKKKAERELDLDASPIEVLRDMIRNAQASVAIQAAYTICKRAGAVVASSGAPVFVRPVYDPESTVSLAEELERLSVPETGQESDVELAMAKLREVATGLDFGDKDRSRAAQHLLQFEGPNREKPKRSVMVVRGSVTGVPVTEVRYGRQ